MILYLFMGPGPTSSPPGRSNRKIRIRPAVTTMTAAARDAFPTDWHGLHHGRLHCAANHMRWMPGSVLLSLLSSCSCQDVNPHHEGA